MADEERAPPIGVETAVVAPLLDVVRLTGTVTAARVARISSAVGGIVAAMSVEVGDRVGAGEPLAELDDELAQHALERARAAVREGDAALADARRDLAVGRRLAAGSSLPQNEVEAREVRVAAAAAALDRLRAEEALQAARLQRHVVVAPFAGVISLKVAEAGEWLEPGTALVELVETAAPLIDVPVPQDYFRRLDERVAITVQLDAAPGPPAAAGIAATVPVGDRDARSFLLRLRLEDDQQAAMPGSSAQVTLNLAAGETGVVVSRDALIRYPDGRASVWAVAGDGASVTERYVEPGRAFGDRVHLRAGLDAGEQVVVRGNEGLREGQPVRVVGDGPTPSSPQRPAGRVEPDPARPGS